MDHPEGRLDVCHRVDTMNGDYHAKFFLPCYLTNRVVILRLLYGHDFNSNHPLELYYLSLF